MADSRLQDGFIQNKAKHKDMYSGAHNMFVRQIPHRLMTTTTFIILLITCNMVQAGNVDLTLFGETTSASSVNDFGLSESDQVSLKATFDFSSISNSGHESISFSEDSGNSLTLFMGELTFSANNYADFSLGYPLINFIDGVYSGIDYFAYNGINDAPANLFSYGNNWAGIDTGHQPMQSSQQQWATGIWDKDTLTITNTPDIPEPGPFALTALGLIGAVIASRRRKTLS